MRAAVTANAGGGLRKRPNWANRGGGHHSYLRESALGKNAGRKVSNMIMRQMRISRCGVVRCGAESVTRRRQTAVQPVCRPLASEARQPIQGDAEAGQRRQIERQMMGDGLLEAKSDMTMESKDRERARGAWCIDGQVATGVGDGLSPGRRRTEHKLTSTSRFCRRHHRQR